MQRVIDKMEVISMGTWGHPDEGCAFDHNGYDGIKKVIVFSAWVIDSIKILYTRQGKLEWTDRVGGDGGTIQQIELEYPNEYLIGVLGRYGYLFGEGTITSLTFLSNLRQYGPYGSDTGFPRENHVGIPFHVKGGKIIGFQGTAGGCLSSIGFHVTHAEPLPPSARPNLAFRHMPVLRLLYHRGLEKNQDDVMGKISMGLWGYQDDNGPFFNHESYDGIKSVIISHASGLVDSIKVRYTKNGVLEWTDKVGQDDEEETDEVILDAPDEYLIAVTGHYGLGTINSLTLVSNKRVHGPFGIPQGDDFEVTGGKIVGFQGVGGKSLSAIGFHVMRSPATSSVVDASRSAEP